MEARRAGDSVARVRELENIRNFLTSSALTLVVDLVFTAAFLAVMFTYSPPLSWIVVGSIPVYTAISLVLFPIFRRRLGEKFDRGAEAANDEQARQAGQPTYVALVSLDRASIRTEDGDTPLEAGMAVATEIKTGKRTVISYLISPLLRFRQEGLRER